MTARTQTSRRALLKGCAAVVLAPVAAAARADAGESPGDGDAFRYEVQRTEAEWRERLTPEEYFVLRENGTEVPHTSLLAFEDRPGNYFCKGCDLWVYESGYKVPHPEIGWVFFSVSRENAVLTGIDLSNPYSRNNVMTTSENALIEVHCRRCGSHFGHIVKVKGRVLHCINGASLAFEQTGA